MSKWVLTEGAAPGTPPTGKVYVYVKTDGLLYSKDDSGTESAFNPNALLANGTTPLTANWDVGAFDITAEQFHSDIAIGTSPFTVVSTTVVTNLNADTVDGIQGADIIRRNGSIPLTADWDVGAFDITAEQFHSDITTGTSPFTVVSTTVVTNLNADTVDGIEGAEILQRGGSVALTADWDVGAFDIRSESVHQDAGAATAVVAQRFGASATEGYTIMVLDETVSGLAAISTDLTQDIPTGALLLSLQANIETLVVSSGTSVKVGIGPTADPDKYGITSAFTKNLKIDTIPAHAVLSGAEDVQINMCETGGAIGDSAASAGAVRVRIVYAVLDSLDDAA